MSTNPNTHNVQAYLFFDGRCEEALEFYRQALGAQVEMLMHFKDSPEPPGCPSASGEKVMHASVRIGDTTVMASPASMVPTASKRSMTGACRTCGTGLR